MNPEPPSVTLEFTPSFAVIPGQTVILHPIAGGLSDISTLTLSVNGTARTLDSLGRSAFVPTQPGRYRVEATATDLDGFVGRAERWLLVKDPSDVTAPSVALDADLVGAILREPTTIVGTVSDTNLDTWRLVASRLDGAWSQVLAEGTGTIADDTLATLVPAGIERGFYRLELTARDISGRGSAASVIVEITAAGTTMGRYTRQDLDAIVKFGGKDIEIRRFYDAWDSDVGSLGPGWSLGQWDPDPQLALPTGPLERYRIFPALRDGTRLYLTLPDGQRAGFTFRPESLGLTGVHAYRPKWVPDAGVTYTLEASPITLQRAGQGYFELGSGQPYHPGNPWLSGPDFVIGDASGTRWWIDFDRGVRREIKPDGSWIEFAESGWAAASGSIARFQYDGEGRLARVTGSDGSQITYGFDSTGQLIDVTTSVGGGARYGYEPGRPGRLTVAAPVGGPPVAVEHGANARHHTLAGGFHLANGLPGSATSGLSVAARTPWVGVAVRETMLETTLSGSVLVRLNLTTPDGASPPAVPTVAGALLLASRTVGNVVHALYELPADGAFVWTTGGVALAGATWSLSLAGDLNADGTVDGVDSGLMNAAQGTVTGDVGFLASADTDGDGDVDGQDRWVMIRNYGMGSAPTAAPAPVAGIGTTGTSAPASGASATVPTGHAAASGSGRAPVSPTGLGDGAADLDASPLKGFATGALPPVAGLRNGTFFFSDPAHPAFGWDVRGAVAVEDGRAILTEDAVRQTGLWQFFYVPAWATGLEFVLDEVSLGTTTGLPGDTLEVALLNGTT
ncbi:MAG: RHS repeat protein, partial [Verrucomicrobiales bacterium]|nr:RHS repeat protein [Verrucomicrobiales bacterium]